MRLKRIPYYRVASLIFFLWGLAEVTWGQGHPSDAAYARGVELYGMRKYAEAIPFFLRADSLERLKHSEEVAETTNVVLWIANCYYKLGDFASRQGIS